MKRIFSLMLVALMLVSAIPTVFALQPDAIPCPECGTNLTECLSCGVDQVYCAQCGVCTEAFCESAGAGSTIPEVGTTTVTLVGTQEAAASYYEVAVPAKMAPGGNADITAEGFWRSTETLKVTAPEKVTLYYGDQSMDVAIQFDGITQAGNDMVDSTATANLKLADASVKFGTWTGVIEYDVELV